MVVLGHVNYYARPDASDWWPYGMYCVPLLSLCLPIFFLLSGFFAVGHRPGSAGDEVFAVLRRRLGRLVPPFLFWSGVTILMLSLGGIKNIVESTISFLTGAWHLWFVFALMQLEIVASLVSRFLRPRFLDWFLAASAALSASAYAASDVAVFNGVYPIPEPWLRKIAAVWIVFFAVGVWLRWRDGALVWLQARLRLLAVATLGGYALYLWELSYEGKVFGDHRSLQIVAGGLPFQVLGVLLVVLLAQRVRPDPEVPAALSWLARGSRHTFSIYLMHIPFLILLYEFLWAIDVSVAYWPTVPLLTIAAWSLSRITAGSLTRRLPRPVAGLMFGTAPVFPARKR